jgi:phosphatidylinositol alpha-1,6-mannosyltransferase
VPEVEWVVVGDGPLRPWLEGLASARRLDESVRFAGPVDAAERERWLDRAWVLAMPSRVPGSGLGGEGFGLAYLEAAAHGVPAVAGSAGGATDAVIDGETGVLVDPLDDAAIADAIAELLLDDDRRGTLGDGARRRAGGLGWSAHAAAVEDLIEGLVASRGRR